MNRFFKAHPSPPSKLPRISKQVRQELLEQFELLCESLGKTCGGFDTANIRGPDQWVLLHESGRGWAIVSGWGGCGIPFGFAVGHVRTGAEMIRLLWMANLAIQMFKS